ncbi:hypothetical protein JCM6882_000284 [Rhodosporidiobolus microsporus]
MTRTATVTIVRHGETSYNHAGIIQGHLDTPLNDQGEAQARWTGKWFALQGVHFDEAWTSDLQRAKRTAGLILESQKEPVTLQQDERIRERFLGNLQGKRRGDPGTDPSTVEPIPQLRARLWSFWDELFPSPSPSSSSTSSITSSSAAAEEKPKQILYVSHGAAIREFIRSVVEEAATSSGSRAGQRDGEWEVALPEEEAEMLRSGSKRIDNCSRTVVEVEEVEGSGTGAPYYHFRLTLYADDSHFDESSRAPSPTANADVVE